MILDRTQGAAVYALLEAIAKAAQEDHADLGGIRRLTDAAQCIMTEMRIEDSRDESNSPDGIAL